MSRATQKDLRELLLVTSDAAEELGQDDLATQLRWAAKGPGALRRAHLGKYEGGLLIDEYLDHIIANWGGPDDSIGEVDGPIGAYDRIQLAGHHPLREIKTVIPAGADEPLLTWMERNYIRDAFGVIRREDSQGFVSFAWYDDAREYRTAWQQLEEEEAALEEGGVWGGGGEDDDDGDGDGDDPEDYHEPGEAS